MTINRPFKRTYRQFADGAYEWRYVTHPKYASTPLNYLRAFDLIQKDLLDVFQYVEPSDTNLGCYSYRIHELLMRACIEVEANCKAILTENNYVSASKWTMRDYQKIERSHRLSGYRVRLPVWHGPSSEYSPFAPWRDGLTLGWYQAYNEAKHDRHAQFESANLKHLVEAVCALFAILAAQFGQHEFSPIMRMTRTHPADGFNLGIGEYLYWRAPTDWPPEQRYDFDWDKLASEDDPFQTFTF